MAAFGRIDVGKKAENAATVKGTGRKGVHVEEIVSGSKAKISPFFLKRAKTGIVMLPLRSIRSEKEREKVGHLLGVVSQNFFELSSGNGIFRVVVGDPIDLRLIGDIFSRRGASLALSE